ncbi:MAG: glycosyltransferase family 2 protein [Chitinophagaceae bacterium]
MNPSVSIVILNWNGRKYLDQFLPSILNTTYPNKEIVIIDNASTDDSVNFVENKFPTIKIIRLPVNYGFAKGYNEGLKQVKADYFVLLNSDVEVEPGWIEPCMELLESNKNIAVCQPKVLQYNNKTLFEYAGGCGGWLDRFGYPFAKGRIFDVCEKDEGQYNEAAPVFWASGAAFFIRANQFHEMKGFDEYFFAHQEEIDLCWRLQWAGYLIYCCPQSVVYHVGGGTLPKGNSQKVFLNFRNNLVMLAKNLTGSEVFLKISWRFVLDGVSATKSLFAGQGTYFIAVIRAHGAFLEWLFLKRSSSIFPDKRNKKWKGYFPKSVVWKHFIEGKNKFSEIVENKS